MFYKILMERRMVPEGNLILIWMADNMVIDILELDYDAEDVVERFKDHIVGEYSETKIGKENLNPPLLFIFGKAVNNKLLYVKMNFPATSGGEVNPKRLRAISRTSGKQHDNWDITLVE